MRTLLPRAAMTCSALAHSGSSPSSAASMSSAGTPCAPGRPRSGRLPRRGLRAAMPGRPRSGHRRRARRAPPRRWSRAGAKARCPARRAAARARLVCGRGCAGPGARRRALPAAGAPGAGPAPAAGRAPRRPRGRRRRPPRAAGRATAPRPARPRPGRRPRLRSAVTTGAVTAGLQLRTARATGSRPRVDDPSNASSAALCLDGHLPLCRHRRSSSIGVTSIAAPPSA